MAKSLTLPILTDKVVSGYSRKTRTKPKSIWHWLWQWVVGVKEILLEADGWFMLCGGKILTCGSMTIGLIASHKRISNSICNVFLFYF